MEAEFSMRFDTYKRRRRRAPGLGRIVILCALLVVVMAAMLELQRKARLYEREAREGESASIPPEMLERPRQSGDFTQEDILSVAEETKLLSHVQDQLPLAVREQRIAYYYLLNKLRLQSLDALLQGLDERVRYEDFIDQPQIVRGAVVRVRGHLYRLIRTEMDAKASGLSHVYEGQIRGAQGRMYSIVLVEAPTRDLKPGIVSRKDHIVVEVVGAFLQNVAYADRSGGHSASPLIIAKAMRRVQVPGAEGARLPLWVGWLGGGAVLIVGIWVVLRRGTRTAGRVSGLDDVDVAGSLSDLEGRKGGRHRAD